MRQERNTEYGRQQQDGRHVVTVHRRVSDGVFTTVRMTYPSKDHDRWDPVAVAVTRSMKPAPGG
jgi:hypothetical protein